jgi:hypothetical protein
MKKIVLLMSLVVAVMAGGVVHLYACAKSASLARSAVADGCCCSGTWDPNSPGC